MFGSLVFGSPVQKSSIRADPQAFAHASSAGKKIEISVTPHFLDELPRFGMQFAPHP